MLGLRAFQTVKTSHHAVITPQITRLAVRSYAATTKKKKLQQQMDITQIPLNRIPVLGDYYVPPKVFAGPVRQWHRLVGRRLTQFFLNTYNVYKFKTETSLKPKFDSWKDRAIDLFVHTNKAFAAGNVNAAKDFLGYEALNTLKTRAESLPKLTKLQWDLVKIVENPKVVVFTAIPDTEGVTARVQFVMKLVTDQKVTVTTRTATGLEPNTTTRTVTDYLVYSLDPFSEEMMLVGSVDVADFTRLVMPEMDVTDVQAMKAFQMKTSDIFRPKN